MSFDGHDDKRTSLLLKTIALISQRRTECRVANFLYSNRAVNLNVRWCVCYVIFSIVFSTTKNLSEFDKNPRFETSKIFYRKMSTMVLFNLDANECSVASWMSLWNCTENWFRVRLREKETNYLRNKMCEWQEKTWLIFKWYLEYFAKNN